MRPIASTAVASIQNTAAPESASELMWVKCQSLASPSTDEYWHIGATMMRLGKFRPRSLIGENNALMGDFRMEGRNTIASCVARRPPRLNPPLPQPSLVLDRWSAHSPKRVRISFHQRELQQQIAL